MQVAGKWFAVDAELKEAVILCLQTLDTYLYA
jgi:hypothetical protein